VLYLHVTLGGKEIDKNNNKKNRSRPKTKVDSLYRLSFPLRMCNTEIVYKIIVMKGLIWRD